MGTFLKQYAFFSYKMLYLRTPFQSTFKKLINQEQIILLIIQSIILEN